MKTAHRWTNICSVLAALALAVMTHAATAATRGDGYARLLGMNIGAKNYGDPAYVDAMARLDIVILGFYPGWHGDRNSEGMSDVVRQLKTRNPDLRVGQYTVLNESGDDPAKNLSSRDRIDKLNAENWWLRRTNGSKAAWTSRYGNFDINVTKWAKPDSNGDRYPQWLAKRDNRVYFEKAPFDVWYFDNAMVRSRAPKADWQLDGQDVAATDPQIEAAYREGTAAYWSMVRKLQPGIVLIGNVDSDLSTPEYRGQLDGAFLEGLMGRSYSLERRGWRLMMQRYLGVKANLRGPAIVGFNVAGDPHNYPFFRYAFCSFLMGDGYFSFTDATAGYSSVPWFDEYDVRLGKAVDPPQTRPASSGVYQRRFANALILVNPDSAAHQVTLDQPWKHFEGRQDASVNNGQAVTQVTVGARDGLVLVKE